MGKKWKQWQTLFSWAPKSLQTVTVAVKLRHLFLGRKAMTNLDSVLESRASILLTKVHIVKTMVFPVVMYRCELDHKEGWALKDSCLPTLVLEKTLESPLDGKEIKPVKGNQPWIFIWKDWYWSWSSNTVVTWCKEPTHWKRLWFWERLRAGGEGGDREWDGWMASSTQWTWVWSNSRRYWRTGKPGMLQSMGSQRVRHNWEELNNILGRYLVFLHPESPQEVAAVSDVLLTAI